eukprot:TRINITY_DN7214_c0_g1_i1.p1 TRINITY_DN7214_c0_g1~~TRINITY_DN7214_c0_g1_i1.p1  ORF type:complete len:404 (+),score=47.62 TRINITY_DN7214_c0_g1_i1:94-1305(+)
MGANSPESYSLIEDDNFVFNHSRNLWFTFSAFFILGTGALFPYNTLITAIDYFRFIFPHKNIEFLLPVCMAVPNLVMYIPVILFGGRFSFGSRILMGFVTFLITMITIPIITATHHFISFGTTLTCAIIAAIADSVLEGSLYGFAGLFPPQNTVAIVTGTGMAGVIVCCLRIFTKLSLAQNGRGLQISTAIFFSLCVLFLVFCVVCFFLLRRQDYTKFILQYKSEDRDSQRWRKHNSFSYLVIFRKTLVPITILMISMTISMSVFPGFTARIKSHYGVAEDWFSIILITVYNFADLLGKFIARWILFSSNRFLWCFTAARVVYIPLIILCAKDIIANDVVSVLIIICFGVTGGYINSVAMAVAPQMVSPSEQEMTGTVMIFFVSIGLNLGAVLSYFFLYLSSL